MTTGAVTVGGAAVPSESAVAIAARFERVAGRLLRRLRAGRVDGLTPSQSSLLHTVRELGPVSLSDVAAHEAVTAPTASRAVDTLVQRGLLRTRVDPTDGRRHLIELDGDAVTLLEERIGGAVSLLAGRVEALDPGQQRALRDALPVLTELVESLSGRRPV